jgi:hypothetical protein
MKVILIGFILALLLSFGPPEVRSSDFGERQNSPNAGSGVLQKMIVKSGLSTSWCAMARAGLCFLILREISIITRLGRSY